MIQQPNEFQLLDNAFPCDECQAGIMHLKHIAYLTWLGEELITVPNFPAWVCDLCGRRDYDERAVNWLSTFLNPAAGRKTGTSKKKTKITQTKKNPPRVSQTK